MSRQRLRNKEEENVASLAEHPFVQRSKEDKNKPPSGAEIIIARKLGKKEKKREREREEDTESEKINGETTSDDKPIRTKNKSKRRKGLKEKVESGTTTPCRTVRPVQNRATIKIDAKGY